MMHTPRGTDLVTEEDLHAFVDEVLSPQRRAAVEDYLARHPDAARQIEGYRQDRQLLKAMGARIASEPVPGRFSLDAMSRQQPPRFKLATWSHAATIVLSLSVGMALGWAWRDQSGHDAQVGVAAVAREAANSYMLYALDQKHPVEMGPDRHDELIDWVSQRTGARVRPPSLDKAGYQYLGGRLVMTPNGPGGLFIYRGVNGARIALLVRTMNKVDRQAPMMQHAEGGLIGYAWADEGIGFSVVGARGIASMKGLANEMRRQVTQIQQS